MIALVLIATALTGPPQDHAKSRPGALACAPKVHVLPCKRGMRRGARYHLDLRTHCGIRDEWFDGRLWVAKPQLSDGSDNPPRGWGNPWQRGTISLVTRTRAVFRAGRLVAHFLPARRGYRSVNCE
jgi:hypothetical protein